MELVRVAAEALDRLALAPCGTGVGAWGVTQHHKHLVGTLCHEVVARRQTAQDDDLECTIAVP